MIGKIFRGYSAVLGSAFRFAALIGVCIGAGFLLVYPLWNLAVLKPGVYTLVFCIIVASLTLTLTGIQLYKAARKNGRRLLLSIARKGVLLAGFSFFVIFILRYERVPAILVLILTIMLYGYLAFVLSPKKIPPEGR